MPAILGWKCFLVSYDLLEVWNSGPDAEFLTCGVLNQSVEFLTKVSKYIYSCTILFTSLNAKSFFADADSYYKI